MQNTRSPQHSNNPPRQTFKARIKRNFGELGMGFKREGSMALGMTILNAIQTETKARYDSIDADPIFHPSPEPKISDQEMTERFVKYYQTNMNLMQKVLNLKEELINRVYKVKSVSKPNQEKLNSIMADIRNSRWEIKHKLSQLQATKNNRAFYRSIEKQRQSSYPSEQPHLGEQDYLALKNGLSILGRQTFELQTQLSAYSSTKPPKGS